MRLDKALATPKNPLSVYANPASKKYNDESPIITANYNTLLSAIDENGKLRTDPSAAEMRRYLGAGFALSDLYCKRFFQLTDEAYRRRKFGRTLTNDVGTAVSTIMGLANAGQSAVTAVAATTGLADSTWRNYDDAFVISPQLSVVRNLVLAAQDNFRARTLAVDAAMPADFGTAQSIIERYAEQCSFLGMQSLLEQSATKQQDTLKANTNAINTGTPDTGQDVTESVSTNPPASTKAAVRQLPATATPTLAPNK